MKRICVMLIICCILIFTGCSIRQGMPDEYYIEKYKEEAKLTGRKNLICVVNTISNSQVKVTCNYDVGVNCIERSKRAYTGYACIRYDHYETRTVNKVYDIVYEQ